MSFDKIRYSDNFYEQSSNFVFDGSIVFPSEPSSYITRIGDDLYFNDPSIGPISLYSLSQPANSNVNLGNIIYVSVDGDSNGQIGNPYKPYDISTAINVVAQQGYLIYVYPGDYTFEQSLTPTDINVWLYYFMPDANIDFGEASIGTLIGLNGSNTYVYGAGNFFANNSQLINEAVSVFEFDEVTVKEYGFSGSESTYVRGKKIIQNNALHTNPFVKLSYNCKINEIYIYDPIGLVDIDGGGANNTFIDVDYIYSVGIGLRFRNGSARHTIRVGAIDSSNHAISAVNTASGPYSNIFVGDISVWGAGAGIHVLPDKSVVNVNRILTYDGEGIMLGGQDDVTYNIGSVISTNNYAISNDSNISGKCYVKAYYVESLNSHALIHQARSVNDQEFPYIYDIQQIKCSSSNYGIYVRSVTTINDTEEVRFRNSYVEAGYPVYLGINTTSHGESPLSFKDMKLYSTNVTPYSVYSPSYAIDVKFSNVFANVEPNSNVNPLWDGIKVTDRVFPIT